MLLVHALLVVVLSCFVHFGSAALDPRWKLMWSDEFNDTSIDTTKWNVVNNQGIQSNGEKEYYLPSQVYIQDGALVLRSDNISYVSAFPYKSGEVNSNGRFASTFGRYEVYAKLPGGKGMWPAHWLLSEDLCWPVGTEFDILETIGDKHNIYGTVHFAEQCYVGIANGTVYEAPFDYSADFHTYAIEWNQTSVAWFVDDVQYSIVYDDSVYKGKPFAIDTSPHYWILNTAVGGYWPGDPDETTVFPQYHIIDYVRVYGWEPCQTGCGDHGCCYEPLEICICDENYQGTNCEYISKGKTPGQKANCTAPPPPSPTAPPPPTPPPCVVPSVKTFNRTFTTPFNSSVDFFGNSTQGPTQEIPSNANIVNGQLVLTASTKGCPSACAGQPYGGAVYESVQSFPSGTFGFKMQASDVPGAATVVWISGWDSTNGWNAYQFLIAGDDSIKVTAQLFWNGWEQQNGGEYPLGFDSSQGVHTYEFQYHPDGITAFYVDGAQLFTLAPGPVTNMGFKIEHFINPEYYGKYDGSTSYVYIDELSWTTNCGSSRPARGNIPINA